MTPGKNSTIYGTSALLRDLWRLTGKYHGRFLAATLLQISSGLVWLYPAYALGKLVEYLTTYTPGTPLDPIIQIAILWVAASLWHNFAAQAAQYIGYQVAEQSALDAELRTIEHMLLLDLTWHEQENSGNKLKRIQRGGEGINQLLRIWLDKCLWAGISFLGMIPILATFDMTVAIVVTLFLASYFLLSYFLTRSAGEAAHIVNTAEEDLQGIAFETINNVRSVKVLGMHEGLLGIIGWHLRDLSGKIRTRIRRFRIREIILVLWAQAFRLGLTFAIAFGVLRGSYQIGFLVLFYTYFNYIWEAIDQLSQITLDFIIARYGVSRMVEIMEEPIRIDHQKGKSSLPDTWDALTVRNLSFSYGKKRVLKDISLTIARGQKIGIVGVSGAGKSTLFKLLLKEYEQYDGEILIGSLPLRSIARSSLFRRSAVVLQDTEVFNFSLRDNITLANPDSAHDEALLRQALTIAHITDFVEKLPNGLDTVIGEKGIKLSGGEKQRVGIARAIFKQPEILFLDEATSHLDMESEEQIRDSLHHFFRSVTAIVIAHRLSTIREMDRIILLENGRIIEEGSFEELMEKKGRFHELWEKQKF